MKITIAVVALVFASIIGIIIGVVSVVNSFNDEIIPSKEWDTVQHLKSSDVPKYVPGDVTVYENNFYYKAWTNQEFHQTVSNSDDPIVTLAIIRGSWIPPKGFLDNKNFWMEAIIIPVKVDGKRAWLMVKHRNKEKIVQYLKLNDVKN